MPRCEGTRPPVLKEGEEFIRILVSAPATGARYSNFYFCEKNEPIDVSAHELAGLRTDERLAILVPGDEGLQSVEKDTRIAALLDENIRLKGQVVELQGQVKDRDALLKKAQHDLDEATTPSMSRTPSITDPQPEEKARNRKAA